MTIKIRLLSCKHNLIHNIRAEKNANPFNELLWIMMSKVKNQKDKMDLKQYKQIVKGTKLMKVYQYNELCFSFGMLSHTKIRN